MSIPKTKESFLVVIDGPAGGGKSSLCKKVSEKLGLRLLDTGAIYRSFTYHHNQVNDLDSSLKSFFYKVDAQGNAHSNYGLVGEEIRSQEISNLSSQLSAIPEVRKALLPAQRAVVKTGKWIAEGRDLGSVVFPEADLKIYLDAHPVVRALRRYKEFQNNGSNLSFSDIYHSLLRRDKRDLLRQYSPLTRTLDAIFLDTSQLLQPQVEDLLVAIIEKKL